MRVQPNGFGPFTDEECEAAGRFFLERGYAGTTVVGDAAEDAAADRANAKVARYILEQFQEEPGDEPAAGHLAACDSVRVEDPDAQNGTYGCDTGCDYTRFTAVIACDHGQRHEFEYGEFGTLSDILWELT